MPITPKTDYLNEKAVLGELSKLGINFQLLGSVSSTNDYLREKAKRGEIQHPWAVVAIQQTQGKGTKGRQWISDEQSGLKMSLCIPFTRILERKVSSLSPSIALAACRALLSEGFSNVELKWPNDLLKNGRKVGGILLESISNGDQTFVIAGIGLNLYPSEIVSRQLDRQPASLFKSCEGEMPEERTRIVKRVLKDCADTVFNFRFGAEMPEPALWNKHDRLLHRNVTVKLNSQTELAGIAYGIDRYGRFLLKTPDGKICPLEDGEVEISYGSIVN